MSLMLYKQPIFKDQVFFTFKNTRVEIFYRGQGCLISVNPEKQQDTNRFLQLLQHGGLSVEQLAQECPLIREQIPELLAEFESHGMLRETTAEMTDRGVTGRQFYRELSRFIQRNKRQLSPSVYLKKMADGTITRNELIGYALESYHLTRLFPKLLAPSLANYESPKTQKLLQEFFTSELHHYRLLENSLKSVGITTEQMHSMQPLSMTFAVCSTLGVLATGHPLSFKAALLLFQENDKTNSKLFKERTQALGLPEQFYQPILLSASLNEDEGHLDLPGVLFSEVAYVSVEEQLVVKKNMAILMESMMLGTDEILDYYGNANNIIPRCF